MCGRKYRNRCNCGCDKVNGTTSQQPSNNAAGSFIGDLASGIGNILNSSLGCQAMCTLNFIGKPEQRLACLQTCSNNQPGNFNQPGSFQFQQSSGISLTTIALLIGGVFLVKKLAS